MRFLTILWRFILAKEVKGTIVQIQQKMDIINSIDFEKHDADVLVATTFTKLGRDELKKFPNLEYLQKASTGYDNVDTDYVKEEGITLCNIPTANKQSIAEHVIAFTQAIVKNMVFLNPELKDYKNWPVLTGSYDMEGRTFGILGMGMIGIQLAKRLVPFNVSIIYNDIRRLSQEEEERLGLNFVAFDELLQSSDIISIHLPLTEITRNMFGTEQFSKMKDGAIFINTLRGEIVDEKALVKAVIEKGIRAGIDVYPEEPPVFLSELFKFPNMICSPHIAGVTMESQQRFLAKTIWNVLRYAQGIEPLYKVIS